jgi:hypothetical protein
MIITQTNPNYTIILCTNRELERLKTFTRFYFNIQKELLDNQSEHYSAENYNMAHDLGII